MNEYNPKRSSTIANANQDQQLTYLRNLRKATMGDWSIFTCDVYRTLDRQHSDDVIN